MWVGLRARWLVLHGGFYCAVASIARWIVLHGGLYEVRGNLLWGFRGRVGLITGTRLARIGVARVVLGAGADWIRTKFSMGSRDDVFGESLELNFLTLEVQLRGLLFARSA